MATLLAYGGPRPSCVRHGIETPLRYASRQGYHNDSTPVRLPYVSSPPAMELQTSTKHPALRLRGGRRASCAPSAADIYDALSIRLEQFGVVLRLLLNNSQGGAFDLPEGKEYSALCTLETLLQLADAEHSRLAQALVERDCGEEAFLPCGLALERMGGVLSALIVACDDLPPADVYSALGGVNALLEMAVEGQARGWERLKTETGEAAQPAPAAPLGMDTVAASSAGE